jgi:hypothetical protein
MTLCDMACKPNGLRVAYRQHFDVCTYFSGMIGLLKNCGLGQPKKTNCV